MAEGGDAKAQRQDGQEKGGDGGTFGAQETEQLSSGQYRDPEGRSAEPSEAKIAQPNQQLDDGEGQSEREGHGIDAPAELLLTIGAERNRRRRVVNGNNAAAAGANAGHIDKTNLPISTPRRIRDKEHLRYVASQPCIICGRAPGQAHHLRFAQPRALGRKVSDEWTVPLCVTHHQAVHSVGTEEHWWKEKGIDPIAHAVRLWWDTRHGGVGQPNRIAEAGSGVVFAGRDGPPEAVKQIGSSARTAGRMKDGVCK